MSEPKTLEIRIPKEAKGKLIVVTCAPETTEKQMQDLVSLFSLALDGTVKGEGTVLVVNGEHVRNVQVLDVD